jgi:hypothetical protein
MVSSRKRELEISRTRKAASALSAERSIKDLKPVTLICHFLFFAADEKRVWIDERKRIPEDSRNRIIELCKEKRTKPKYP